MTFSSHRRVILRTEPALVGDALGAWLTSRSDFEVVVDPSGQSVESAGPHDVVVTTVPVDSRARVVVIGPDVVSIWRDGGAQTHPYQDLDQLCSLIEGKRGPPASDVTATGAEGGAVDENALADP